MCVLTSGVPVLSRLKAKLRRSPVRILALLCGLLLGAAAGLCRADTGAGDLPIGPGGESLSPANASQFDRKLAAQGLARGAPVLIRIFKEESELELWMQSGDRFRRFATYKICRWRGVLGPKLIEGDRQSPEGFYSFGQDQLLWQGHWFRAFNINYPNTLDRALGRGGSGILIHGACSSIGCYAMTDPVIDEMFDLIVAAFAAGQARVQVHIFPFHMTLANLARHDASPWWGFWRDLKPASDLFVSTQLPPRVGVCDGRYVVRQGQAGVPSDPRIKDWCGGLPWSGSADRVAGLLENRRAQAQPDATTLTSKPPSGRVLLYAKLAREGKIPKPQPLPSQPASFGPSPDVTADKTAANPLSDLSNAEKAALLGVRGPGQAAATAGAPAAPSDSGGGPGCNTALASCRHFIGVHAVKQVLLRPKTKVAKR